ncbi:3-deoxy-D-manno-octulosonate cytidylyltransferase [Parvibaculum lavamentivorans DS-1]|uniref:3-deoxy-manno-octulosonate cytidylyltransferase n=1 Tax=Parvibaculum lavamentivorans (strain DS-1 / DSM 13023 / NCIMB 13966) TaxID=402881 RepID=KDSB_PARL1|nr:3-deoxy-manno-octulosonate cytidylyltransferase [Parvibaculum lavamentivorans]A7HPP1.1 RecName: Full=3-deoxy-manno-octulosonate cytidylyltransferase; AltName: Full=CMP-2-keto-3-deoxyoctulosonic acid synthase; Short=CKS; Short=CMP-KDO synthase [Parvibaculum lavamentivorans DS-1]ABS61874.1 3-deoxy-D-manno-octulosonate cytidylyltransferase [Parvibaculum lavamentivorans DS-1]
MANLAQPAAKELAGHPLVVIPARMASTRLPGKPLADICGTPMIVQVWRRAMEAGVGRVVVAAAEKEIADAVREAGGEAVLTDPDLPSGSDRVWQAVCEVDPEGHHTVILNVQGDLPTLDPALIRTAYEALVRPGADISTLAATITVEEERTNPNVVKAVASFGEGRLARALYFTRATAPWGEGPLYHHIGLYGYRREALARFVALPPSPLEVREKLEQLRALEAGMAIEVALVDTVPLGVDTPADLEKARAALARRSV